MKVGLGDVQAFWNEVPCNTTRSSLPVGSKEFFDDVEKKRYQLEQHIKPFADFPAWKGKKVLEIGCGMGTDTMQFAKAGAAITAVDYSTSSLELAEKRSKIYGLPVKFVHADAEHLSDSLPKEIYDLVYSFGVLHHTPHPENAYREITKYMGRNSIFKLMVYHSRSLKVLGVMLTCGPRKWREKVAYYSEQREGSPVTFTYTKKEITTLLEKCGFKVDDVQIRYLWMRWYLKWMPGPMLRWVERTFGWNLCVIASLE